MRKLRLISPINPLNHLMESDIARRVTFGRKHMPDFREAHLWAAEAAK